MEKVNTAGKFLVVTPNIVVGEDLKEALFEHAGADVDLRTSLDDTWDQGYGLAIFGVSVDQVLNDARVRAMHVGGTRIIVLNGGLTDPGLDGTGILALPQPFLTEDIAAMLRHLGMLAAGKA